MKFWGPCGSRKVDVRAWPCREVLPRRANTSTVHVSDILTSAIEVMEINGREMQCMSLIKSQAHGEEALPV